MRIDIATLFPDMCRAVFGESIVGRGIKNGFIEINAHDIRLYTENKHRRADDTPYGGGTGMVMQAQPVFDCVTAIAAQHKSPPRIIYMSPQGEVLTQKKVRELAAEEGLILICGHYEGIDARVLEELGAEEISVGDYVLTGGELPALVLCDAIARMQEGVLPNEDAYSIESHYNGLLEYPQYTKPEVWRGRKVPEILLSGNHKEIDEWREKMSVEVTKRKRNDMYQAFFYERTYPFWDKFLKEERPELKPEAPVASRELPAEQLRLLKRGRLRSISAENLSEEMYVIILDELIHPRFIVVITKIEGDSAYFRTVYKNKGEQND